MLNVLWFLSGIIDYWASYQIFFSILQDPDCEGEITNKQTKTLFTSLQFIHNLRMVTLKFQLTHSFKQS